MGHRPFRGIYLFNPEENFASFFDHCRQWGLNHPILNPFILEIPSMQQELEKQNINYCMNFPVFFDGGFLDQHPQFYAVDSKGNKAEQDWLRFVCPTTPGFLSYRQNVLDKLLKRFEPNALSFDFIRNYVFWEKVQPGDDGRTILDGCFCERCVDQFREEQNTDIPEDNPAAYIKEYLWSQWGHSRSRMVTAALTELITAVKVKRPFLPLYIKLVPWTLEDFDGAIINCVGQDLDALAPLVDGLMPMTFTHMLHRNTAWKKSLIDDFRRRSGKPVYSTITAMELYRKEPLTLDFFKADVDCSMKESPEGFILFNYSLIKNHHDRVEYLLEQIGN